MKKSLIFVAILAISLIACAQNPPKTVTDNFAKKFPGATKVKWDQEEENEWEAEFKLNGNGMSVCFDNAGNWLNTEGELNEKDLPETVMAAVKAAYDGWKIETVESIETTDFKGYEMSIEKGKEELEIQVSLDGKITVNKESEEEDED